MSKITKEQLLKTGYFIDCEYLDKYIDLINSNELTSKEKYITESHHILPKLFFKLNKKPVDNSDNNLVNLKYSDHILAHCYIALSSNNNRFTSGNIDAIIAVLNSNNLPYKTIEEFVNNFDYIKDILKCNHFISDEQKVKLSEISSNSKWYNNGIDETFSRVKPKGWAEGRLPFSDEQKNKIGQSSSRSKWYNNGKISIFSEVKPDGFIEGRIDITGANNPSKRPDVRKKISESKIGWIGSATGKKWYHNNTEEKQFIPGTQPSGWVEKRLPNTGRKISKTKSNKKD